MGGASRKRSSGRSTSKCMHSRLLLGGEPIRLYVTVPTNRGWAETPAAAAARSSTLRPWPNRTLCSPLCLQLLSIVCELAHPLSVFPPLFDSLSTCPAIPKSINRSSVSCFTAAFAGASRTSFPHAIQTRDITSPKMRTAFAPLLLAPLAALASPDVLADFEPAVEGLQNNVYQSMQAAQADVHPELLKRQNNACANNYFDCAGLGAPGLCCPRTAVCSADQAGRVACCPQGAACTGALGAAPTANPTASTTVPFVTASTTAGGPFVQQTNGANHGSTVQNQFYPFPYIPTTYQDAAACSSAYTSCQSDAASCTSALANGAPGITISAPNGGATITAIPSVGLSSAQSICSSLSSLGCSQLTVEACQAFNGNGNGNAAWRAPCRDYLMTAGVALGIAGQLLT
jgi:hypothetical protein